VACWRQAQASSPDAPRLPGWAITRLPGDSGAMRLGSMRFHLPAILAAGPVWASGLRADVGPLNSDTLARPQDDRNQFAGGRWLAADAQILT
jgi:hypothetical protein